MSSKVTESDIHSILDNFVPQGENSFPKTDQSTQPKIGESAVWFVNPVKTQTDESNITPLTGEEKLLNGLSDAVLMIQQASIEEDSDEDGDGAANLYNEWFDIFGSGNYLVKLKQMAANGKIGSTTFRSVCWRLFWECLPEEQDNWYDYTANLRKEYDFLREKYLTDPYEAHAHEDLTVNNPLSQSEESPWHQYFQDNELKMTLNQDLDRLFPEHHFFQKAEVKKVMLPILFCFAREHPQLNYRQGMHEILACIVHVFWNDYSKVTEVSTSLSETVPYLHDFKFIEHDCYHLFRHIMDVIEPWYITVSTDLEAVSRSKVTDQSTLFISPPSLQTTSAITKKLNRIQGYMLKRYDVQLFSYLKQLDIQPQLYGIRWLRLLFGREFQLHQLPLAWDVLFSQGITLDFADYMYVAMLIHIRGHILKADYATCVSYLMKYPASDDLRLIIKKAFYLRNSKQVHGQATAAKRLETAKSPALPREHPVKARLKAGVTEEQQFATVLGSNTVEHKSGPRSRKVQVPWHTPELRKRGVQDHHRHHTKSPEKENEDEGKEQEGKTEFIRDPTENLNRQGFSSHISNVFTKHKVGSPGQIIAKLATKTKSKYRGMEVLTQLAEDHQRLQRQVSLQQREVERISSLSVYCGEKMDSYLSILQRKLTGMESCTDEPLALCLAGLKQIKDFLKKPGCHGSATDLDIDLCDIDKHLSKAVGNELPTASVKGSMENTHSELPMPFEADFQHFVCKETTQIGAQVVTDTEKTFFTPPTEKTFFTPPTEEVSSKTLMERRQNSLDAVNTLSSPIICSGVETSICHKENIAKELSEESGTGGLSLSPSSEPDVLQFDKELSSISSRFGTDNP